MENMPQPIQFLLHYWSLKSSKFNDFHVIWKGECHFLLVIKSNLRLISHRLWHMASFFIENTFSYPLYSTSNLEMFHLLCIPQILYAEYLDTGLIICAKGSPLGYTP